MDREFSPLDDNEVLFVRSGRVLMPNATFKVSEFLDALAQLISEREEEWSEDSEGWFTDGLPCEALRFGNQGWQRGRVRIRLEFTPEKPPKLLREDPNAPRRASRETDYSPRENIYGGRAEIYRDDSYQDEFDTDY